MQTCQTVPISIKSIVFLLFLNVQAVAFAQTKQVSDVVKTNLEKLEVIINSGDLDNAEEELVGLLKNDPEQLEYLAKYGSVLIQKEDSTGIVHLEKVIESNPNHLFARREAGRFYMMQGVRDNSRFERATASEDQKADVFKEARDVVLDKMTKHYEKVVELEPNDRLSLQALMNVYGLLQDEKNYERIVQLMGALKNHPKP